MSIYKNLLILEIILIFVLFLIELFKEKIDTTYIEIATHPKLNKYLYIFGDSLYMIGGSVTGAGVYELIAKSNILTLVFVLGIMLIILGASIRSQNKF